MQEIESSCRLTEDEKAYFEDSTTKQLSQADSNTQQLQREIEFIRSQLNQ
jgi:hypothetical protein